MSDMEKMFYVLQAFRASENTRKYLRYLEEIEEFISGELDEENAQEAISEVREMVLRTNEALWCTYFRNPADKETCKDFCNLK